jgi:hypothetical protein
VTPVTCRHCGESVVVATCANCGREFALTEAHIEDRPRAFDDRALDLDQAGLARRRCDFCYAQAHGEPLDVVIGAGLGQPTCPTCHTEFLSA